MNRLFVRRASDAELPVAIHIITQSIKHAYARFIDSDYINGLTDDNWAPLLSGALGEFTYLVALNRGNIVGTAIMRSDAIPQRPGCGELSALYVAPGYFNNGIGSALLDYAFKLMRQNGFTECVLNVLKDNRRAIDFYRRRGFVMLDMEYSKKIGDKYYIMKYMRKSL